MIVKKDIKKELDEFTSLEISDKPYTVDRYCHVDGLGTFFFNGSYEEKDLVYSAVGFSAPVLIGNEHYYLKKEGNSLNGLYVKKPKAPERKPTVQVGDSVIILEHLQKIAMYNESFKEPLDENPTKEQLKLLQLFNERGKLLRLSYNGHAQVQVDKEVFWVKEHLLYSYEEALEKIKETRSVFSEFIEEKNKR